MKALEKLTAMALLFSACLSAPVFADETGGDLDVTLTVVEADQSVEDLVNIIELPEGARELAKEAAAFGLATANAARRREEDIQGRFEGPEEIAAMAESVVAQAVDQAKEAASNAQEVAREAVKNANEAAEEALKNALSGGATDNVPEEVLDNIPDDVKDQLPADLGSVLDGAAGNIQENIPGS